MTRIYTDLVAERFEFCQALVLRFGIAARQIRPAAAADQERITGKNSIFEEQTHSVLGMARGVDDLERLLAKLDFVAVVDAQIDIRRVRGAVHDNVYAIALAHDFARGVMVRVGVRVDGVKQFCFEEFRQSDIIVGFVDLGVDDNADFLLGASQEIRQATCGTNLLEENFLTSH